MIYRIYPSKDTFITDEFDPITNLSATGSNFGQTETLEVFKKLGVSGALGPQASSSFAHILTQFDFTQFSALTSSKLIPATGLEWQLVMKDTKHAGTLPSSYDVEILPVAASWDEGSGLSTLDQGYANWIKSNSSNNWGVQGGDTTGSAITSHFDTGYEDINANVTNVVQSWLTGTLVNNGLLVRISSSLEANNVEYYNKKFHSRHTNYLDRRPYLEARWDDFAGDDRDNFVFDNSNTLFLYNTVRGVMTNVSGTALSTNCMTVAIRDLSGTIMTTSASWCGKSGMYSASFTLPTGSYSGSTFNDVWFSGSHVYMTGTFYPSDSFAQQSLNSSGLVVAIPGLKKEYTLDEIPRFRLFVRDVDYNPQVVNTASLSPVGDIVTKGYYKITNDRTLEQVVPFGTGSYSGGTDWTRLSYDGNGNYFNFFISTLSPGNVYRLVFLFDIDGYKQIVDNGHKFRVV